MESDDGKEKKEEKEEIAMLKPSQLKNNPLFSRLNFAPMSQSRPKEQETQKRQQEESRNQQQEVMPNLYKSFAPPRHPHHYTT